ncbi:MAG: MFS transporter, partial [Frankia sp.]
MTTSALDLERPERAGAAPRAVLGVVSLAQFVVVLDATVVNVALPSMQKALGFSESSLSWVVNAYTLVFGGFLLLGGRAADRLGRRRVFVAGMVLFSTGSLVCGLSQSSGMLLAARGAQGLGGALVSPAALAILLTTFTEGRERNRALGTWGAIAGAGGAIGILLGGVIVQTLGWEWVFFINVPVGAAVIAVTPRVVPESRAAGTHRGYDLAGAATTTLGTLTLVFTLIKGNDWGWLSGRTVVGLVVAAGLLTAFVVIESRHADPLLPLRIFRNRSLASGDAAMLLVAAALFGVFYFCTLYLQQVLDYSPVRTGLAYTPLSVGLIAASTAASQLVNTFGARKVLMAGLAITTCGFLLLSRITATGGYFGPLFWGLVVLSVGLGLAFVSITVAATSGVGAEDAGLASGLLNTTQQVGGSLGLAVLSAVATSAITNSLRSGHPQNVALTDGFTRAFTVGAGLCALGFVIAVLFVRDIPAAVPVPPPVSGAERPAPAAP